MKTFATFALIAPAFAASAAALDHDFVEAGYILGEIEDDFFAADFDTWDVRGNKAFEQWLFVASYESLSTEPVRFLGVDVTFDRTLLTLGGGYAFSPAEAFAIPVRAGFARGETEMTASLDGESVSESESDTGYFASLGLRARLHTDVELEFEHRFVNIMSDRVNDWRVDLRYTFTPAFAASVGYHDFEGDTAIGGAVRWYY